MQAILPQGLFPQNFNRDKAVSVTASIAVNLAMVVAFASIANIDGKKIEDGAPLVLMGLGGSDGEAEKQEKAAAPAGPPPAAKPVPAAPAAAQVQYQDKPLDQKLALLPPEPLAQRSEASAPEPTADASAATEEQREAAEQQRRAQEAAKARAAEQAQADAKAAAAQAGSRGSPNAGGSGGYGALVFRHLQRFKRGNSVGAGAAFVRVSIDGSGGLQDCGIIRSSGSPAFDREALQTVRRAAPFPRPPEGGARTVNFNFTGT